MNLIRLFVVTGVVVLATAFSVSSQRKQLLPSISFGEAQVSLGMSVGEVVRNLAENGRHIEFMPDKHTALVHMNNAPISSGSEGQVTFFDGRVTYAAFHFPDARDAYELAQEIAGAVENMDTKSCTVTNYSSHGTGGGVSETVFDCGSKSFDVMITEILGHSERYARVEITIGEIRQK